MVSIMARSRSIMDVDEFVDLAPDIIDFGDLAGRGTPDEAFFPDDGELVGILPDFLSCANDTVVTQYPVASALPAQNGAAMRKRPADLDDFDFG